MTRTEIQFLLLTLVIFVAACIETDIYLPAFPDMMVYFDATEETIQRLLTWNFFGICVAGPIYGPISDAFGRKKPLVAALGLFLLGSILTVTSVSFSQMLWGRLLQGIGSGGCFTLGTALIFDAFRPERAVKAINFLNSTIPFVMAAAPLAGGYLNHVYGFRSNFIAIGVFVTISLLITVFFFKETLAPENRKDFCFKKIAGDFKRTLTCIPFWQMTVMVSLMFAGYLVFLSGTAILFVMELGVSKQAIPYFQAAILGAWLVASLTSNRIIDLWGIPAVKKIGTAMVIVGGAGLLAATVLTPTNPIFLTVGMLVYAFGVNWTQSLYFPEGMQLLPDIKGVTASVLTSARLLITAAVVGLASSMYNSTIYPISAVVVGIILVIIPLIYLYEKGQRKTGAMTAQLLPGLSHDH